MLVTELDAVADREDDEDGVRVGKDEADNEVELVIDGDIEADGVVLGIGACDSEAEEVGVKEMVIEGVEVLVGDLLLGVSEGLAVRDLEEEGEYETPGCLELVAEDD